MTPIAPLACALALSLTHATVGAHEICTAVADARTGEVLVQRGDCAQRVPPASTFRIAIGLVGYEAGFLKDEHQPTLPFLAGYVDWRKNWKRATDPSTWMKNSVVWHAQQVTTSPGIARLADETRQFQYRNADHRST
ncbi:penicillin-binding transpeptidase domain-containing protein [Massilia scottii]|uniref:penicillin-binding transpeptidase domain-containing protein n=1 Tax=Massilia scottii TaxID=3057166 RepID=UPI0027967E1E|nr:penicillin-binding transpeptidase domain-containing protein [Massilia sp. CCM 9029]MDQ1833585.1 penicillin-binding transpeptidase domain-containing protein [Massilia sp. CCM 9029]